MTNSRALQHATTLTIDQALQQAVAHHQAGRFQDAERLYRAILKTQPNHPDANHNLGVLAVQVQQPTASLPHFKAALEANPNQGQYWLSYIDALIQTGQTDAGRYVLEQGRQQGLQGDAIDVLDAQLSEGEQGQILSNADHHHALKESLSVESAAPQTSMKNIKTNSVKPRPDSKHTPPQGKSPSPEEINTLVVLFTEARYMEAARLAQVMTESYPLHGFGWKVMGAVLKQMGRNTDALVFMKNAAALSPGDAETHNNLGNTLKELERLDEAEASYRMAIQIKPDYAEAHNNLGVTLKEMGRLEDAEASYRRATQIKSEYVVALNNLGMTLNEMGRLDDAQASYRQVLKIVPDCAEAHVNLGIVLQALGRLEEADACYRQALVIKSDYAEAHNNLGNVLNELARLNEAMDCYRLALEIKPDYVEALYNFGNTLKRQGKFAEAEVFYRRWLVNAPNFAEAHNNLGAILQGLGRYDEAEASCRRALIIKPDSAVVNSNLGNALREQGLLVDAVASYRRALEVKPDYAEARYNLGGALYDLDDLEQAVNEYQNALNIDPDNVGLDAAVNLAVLWYLDGSLEQCQSKLIESQAIVEKIDGDHKNTRIYWRYLNNLISWHQQGCTMSNQSLNLETLHVIGESHSLSCHTVEISYCQRRMLCSAEWIPGCKQWHLANNKKNKYKYKFEAVMARLPRHSNILLTFGEIDCRPNEGIMKVWSSSHERTLEEVAEATVKDYIKYVQEVTDRYSHQLIINGVPATNIKMDAMTDEEKRQFIHLIRIFNTVLKEQSLAAGMCFLDVYALTDRGDGIASGQWHIDDYHLLPTAIVGAFAQYCIQ